MHTDSLQTEREVAERLHVSERTVGRLRERGALPFVRVGGQVRFQASDVEAYIASHTQAVAS